MTLKREIKITTFIFPLLFAAVMWAVKWYEHANDVSFVVFGVYPKRVDNLIGIITSPFIHGDMNHIINNTTSFLVLGFALFYFYKKIAWKVFLWSWFMSGLWLWSLARPAYHIGASGVIYALASFIFFIGVFNKNTKMLALSLFVVFLYGSMVWGLLPTEHVSFEGHAYGAIAGLVLALYYRKEGPKPKKYRWEEEDDLDDSDPYWEIGYVPKEEEKPMSQPNQIVYIYKPREQNDE